jgi:hypothetical protein
MRSLAVLRYSVLAGGACVATATAIQLANFTVVIPVHHLRLAWTLARVLVQL